MPPYKDVPARRLVPVQAGVRLLDTTAAAFLAARDAYAAEEHRNLTIALPAGGYRSHAMDVDMHAHPDRYNITPGVGLLPIDYSVHRTGQCVDIANGLDWMIANGHRWGLYRPLAFDHNHFQHDPTAPAGDGGTPIQEDDMYDAAAEERLMKALNAAVSPAIYRADSGAIMAACVPTGFYREFADTADFNTFKALDIVSYDRPVHQVSNASYRGIKSECDRAAKRLIALSK